MIENNQKTSLLIPSQLPEFIRDNPDYSNFVLFLQAYYEWLEQNGNITERSKNLLNYKDIDKTTNEFLDYFTNDFLPYFPKDTLISKQKAIKTAKELYQTKGTPASFKFLFKILFNSDLDIFYTKEAVLRASDGKWYVAKSLKLSSIDPNLLKINNLRLFGETSKSIATVENTVQSGTKTEVFISNVERLFESGEIVRVVDSNNQDVLFNGQPLRAKLVGQISQIKIDPIYRGLLYQPGDPVVVYGGLNPNTAFPVGASAEVGQTTSGSIQRINVLTGGYGYSYYPNTLINITNATGANAIVGSVDPTGIANIAFVPTDTITLKKLITIGASNYFFSNIATSNANTTLANALTFVNFSTYPISSILVTNGGGGITKVPDVTAQSTYPTDITDIKAQIKNLGILAPIQVINGGLGYQTNDKIVFTGGSGHGVYANVTSVAANGQILKVNYVQTSTNYPLGGIGYRSDALPILSVNSANVLASNASLTIPGILGDGATFSTVVDRAGSVTTINVLEYGEDYTQAPNVSLRVQDIVVSNVYISSLPNKNDVVYQGNSEATSSYTSYFDSIKLLTTDVDPTKSLYNLRVYNYNAQPNVQMPLRVGTNIFLQPYNQKYSSRYNDSGIINYGDGTAKAKSSFLNGLTISQGQYLNSQGQPSSFDVLQSDIYNNYTYQITVEKEISKYREVLLNLLHPTGMNVLGRYAMKSNSAYSMHGFEALQQGHPLRYYTGYTGSTATMVSDFTNKSNNVVTFNNLLGANIANFIFANNTIELTPTNGPYVRSEIKSIDYQSNTVTLTDNVWLTYANVASVTGTAGSNTINITYLTNSFDIINNKNYSNTMYPLMDIVFAGDSVLIANNTEKVVKSVDYVKGTIILTSNLASTANSLMTVKRNFIANTSIDSDQIRIYGPIGLQYIPQLATEDGRLLITENGNNIILG